MNPSTSIDYIEGADHVRIAWAQAGTGPALVLVPSPPFSSYQLSVNHPQMQRFFEHLSSNHQLIRYDSRGSGLSDREVTDFSLEAQLRDLDSVVEMAGASSFALFATFYAGPIAIAYAARNPDKVTGLILFHSFARTSDYIASKEMVALKSLIPQDWDLYVEVSTHMMSGWGHGDSAHSMADIKRSIVTKDVYEACFKEAASFDASRYLTQIRTPTLILQRRDFKVVNPEMSRGLASAIPNARLKLLDGDSGMLTSGNWLQSVQVIEEFLSPVASVPQVSALPLTNREQEILRLLALGMRNKEMAAELELSTHTVERHIANIYLKLGAKGRADAIYFAIKNGLA